MLFTTLLHDSYRDKCKFATVVTVSFLIFLTRETTVNQVVILLADLVFGSKSGLQTKIFEVISELIQLLSEFIPVIYTQDHSLDHKLITRLSPHLTYLFVCMESTTVAWHNTDFQYLLN